MGQASVLLLHSDSDDRDMYTEYLRQNGYAVTIAGSTDEALPLIPIVDALITGLMVPGSFEAVDLIRRVRGELSSLPIVVVTAISERREQAVKAGADVVLAKPCFPEQLMAELRKAMEAATVRFVVRPDRRSVPDRRSIEGGNRRDTA